MQAGERALDDDARLDRERPEPRELRRIYAFGEGWHVVRVALVACEDLTRSPRSDGPPRGQDRQDRQEEKKIYRVRARAAGCSRPRSRRKRVTGPKLSAWRAWR